MAESTRRDERRGEVSLSADVRAQLGLDPDESVGLVHVGVHTLLLERTGAPAGIPRPEDCELALVANVSSFPLADLLGLVHASGRSGLLSFSHADHAKSVYLRAGEVVFATSNQRVDRLGSCLVRGAVISLEQLREAEHHFSPPERFGKVLVERGFLTPRELWNGVKFQVEEIVRSLFSYTSGTVCFWEGEVQPDNVVRLALPTRRLVAEGLQRRDELLRFLALLEDARVRIEAVEGRQGSLAGVERQLFEALREEVHFPALCQRVGLDSLAGARTLQLMRLLGAVRVRRGDSEERLPGSEDLYSHEQEDLRECVVEHVKLLAELAAPLVAVEGAGPVCERLTRVIDELAVRYPELLAGVQPGPAGTLDPEELAQRALRLAAGGEEQARAALGELVAYLEFELKNNPRIGDPDRFLAAIEPLRARLSA